MFEQDYYLAILLVSLAGLATLDRRYKLAVWYQRARALKTISLGVIFFSIWDLLGIHYAIFYIGSTRYLTGINLAPQYPLEELFFLILLMYTALLLLRGAEKLWPRT